jgi:hypothetical protein
MRTLLLLTILGASLYAADDESNPKTCSNATVKGQYGYTITGTGPSGGPGAPLEQVIGVGVRRYDGHGAFTQVDSRKGSITGAVADQPASGTYTVNPDCTGKMFLSAVGQPVPAELRFVVVNKGKEIRWILLNPPGPVVVGNAVRQ